MKLFKILTASEIINMRKCLLTYVIKWTRHNLFLHYPVG